MYDSLMNWISLCLLFVCGVAYFALGYNTKKNLLALLTVPPFAILGATLLTFLQSFWGSFSQTVERALFDLNYIVSAALFLILLRKLLRQPLGTKDFYWTLGLLALTVRFFWLMIVCALVSWGILY